jgi:membrane protein
MSAVHSALSVVLQVYERADRDQCTGIAAQISFFFVLSLFPFFLVIAAIIGSLPAGTLWQPFVQWMFTYFPRLSQTMLFETILDLDKWRTGIVSFGLVTTIWSASSGFVSLMEALSVAYGGRDNRSYWKKRMIAVVATLGSAVFFISSFGLWTVGHWARGTVATEFGPLDSLHTPWRIAWWLFTLFLLCIGIDLVHYLLPVSPRPWRWLSPGTLFVALSFVLASLGLNFYTGHNVMFPRIYGTLAGFIAFMLWIYISTVILLIGAETDTAIAELNGQGQIS